MRRLNHWGRNLGMLSDLSVAGSITAANMSASTIYGQIQRASQKQSEQHKDA